MSWPKPMAKPVERSRCPRCLGFATQLFYTVECEWCDREPSRDSFCFLVESTLGGPPKFVSFYFAEISGIMGLHATLDLFGNIRERGITDEQTAKFAWAAIDAFEQACPSFRGKLKPVGRRWGETFLGGETKRREFPDHRFPVGVGGFWYLKRPKLTSSG